MGTRFTGWPIYSVSFLQQRKARFIQYITVETPISNNIQNVPSSTLVSSTQHKHSNISYKLIKFSIAKFSANFVLCKLNDKCLSKLIFLQLYFGNISILVLIFTTYYTSQTNANSSNRISMRNLQKSRQKSNYK